MHFLYYPIWAWKYDKVKHVVFSAADGSNPVRVPETSVQRALRRLCKLSLGDEWHWHCAVGYYRRDCASPLRLYCITI
jgi:hypothetical protein